MVVVASIDRVAFFASVDKKLGRQAGKSRRMSTFQFMGDTVRLYSKPKKVYCVHEGGYPPYISEEVAHGESEHAYYTKEAVGESLHGKAFTFRTQKRAQKHLDGLVKAD